MMRREAWGDAPQYPVTPKRHAGALFPAPGSAQPARTSLLGARELADGPTASIFVYDLDSNIPGADLEQGLLGLFSVFGPVVRVSALAGAALCPAPRPGRSADTRACVLQIHAVMMWLMLRCDMPFTRFRMEGYGPGRRRLRQGGERIAGDGEAAELPNLGAPVEAGVCASGCCPWGERVRLWHAPRTGAPSDGSTASDPTGRQQLSVRARRQRVGRTAPADLGSRSTRSLVSRRRR